MELKHSELYLILLENHKSISKIIDILKSNVQPNERTRKLATIISGVIAFISTECLDKDCQLHLIKDIYKITEALIAVHNNKEINNNDGN